MKQGFTRNIRRDDKFIVEEVQEFTFILIPLSGKAKITHVGGNGRFKFVLDGKTYQSEFAEGVATDNENHGFHKEEDKYYDYSKVEMDRDIKKEWNILYHTVASKDYWRNLNEIAI